MAILRLSENVVAMIAAGEAVERPSAVVKELVENSLDAGSSEIKVEIDGGGLEFLSVSDNGHGIEAKDFELLCERHATSKITKYDDIENVKTFGFRGEALASISAVSKITVVSKTKNDKLASKGVFVNGKLVSPIEVSAGLNGTRITVENLFYNIPLRQRIFSFSLKEEKTRSLDIVKKYAIDNPKINFIYAKQSHNKNRLCSPLTKQNGPTPLTMIKLFYGFQDQFKDRKYRKN
ncbi:DNA mismatch repair protein [Bonamia ostreae]|uniref:DNA mismatch repair protein n=1 Tax=Bonamia ostreae TaxID=126728 RepID=A0ABV2AN49_9EUKA